MTRNDVAGANSICKTVVQISSRPDQILNTISLVKDTIPFVFDLIHLAGASIISKRI